VSLARVYLAFRIPAYGDHRFSAAGVAAHVLGWGKAARLYRALVRDRQLAQEVMAFAFPIVVSASMLVIIATARPGVARETLEAALLEEVAAMRDVSADDVTRAVNLLEARHLTDLQRMEERADLLSMYETLFSDAGRINTEVERIRSVSVADVRELAEARFGEGNRAVLWYLPRNGGA
jgi:predicted Zn-dependent peptidase